MSTRPTVFISYAHEHMDRTTLKAFERLLQDVANGQFEILVDDRISIGDRISAHIDQLKSCDAAILLLSPSYRSRVEQRQGGVYSEYKIIYDRILHEESRLMAIASNRTHSQFKCFPIIFSGDDDTSCPKDLKDHLYGNMVYFRAAETERREVVISSQIKQRYEPLISTIASNICAVTTLKLREFRNDYKRYFDMLFIDTKAERIRTKLTHEEWSQMLVQTRSFDLTAAQQSLILVGRKGSGKSTIVQHLFDQNPGKYKSRIHIDLEKFKLQSIYDLIYLGRVRSEIQSLYELVGFFRSAWSLFFFFSCALTLYGEENSGKLTEQQREAFSIVKNYLERNIIPIYFRRSPDYFLIFTYCFELLTTDLETQVKNLGSTRASSMTQVIAMFQEHAVIERLVGTETFNSLVNTVRHCKRKFLFSLDGFDTKFDEFRRQTISQFKDAPGEAAERNRFEIDWLRSMFHSILRLKNEFFDEFLSDKIDFCVTIPKDRFMEARKEDRDGFIYDDRMSYLDWKARELFIMIRKRLDIMNDF